MQTQDEITKEAIKFFQNSYKRNQDIGIEDILWGIDSFPSTFDKEQNDLLFANVTEEELLVVMKS